MIMGTFWPFFLSFDMAKAAANQTAHAVGTEVSRFMNGNLESEVIQVSSIDEVFAHPSNYSSFPTDFCVAPENAR